MANKTIYITYNKGDKNEFTLKVDLHYTPEEKAVYYPVDNAHPGSSAEFEIEKIELTSGSVTDLIFEGVHIDAIYERLYNEDMDDDWGDERDYDDED
jgi:hypothetical protein